MGEVYFKISLKTTLKWVKKVGFYVRKTTKT